MATYTKLDQSTNKYFTLRVPDLLPTLSLPFDGMITSGCILVIKGSHLLPAASFADHKSDRQNRGRWHYCQASTNASKIGVVPYCESKGSA